MSIIADLLKFIGLKKASDGNVITSFKDTLHLWEDDYLMMELLPAENLGFVKAETNRINSFGEEHFDGAGYTNITVIAEMPMKTMEKLIPINDVERIMSNAGLEKVTRFHMQHVGILQGDDAPLGFGNASFAIMCDKQNDVLENIWLAGRLMEEDGQKFVDAILAFSQAYGFIGVNWYCGEYFSLVEAKSVKEFLVS